MPLPFKPNQFLEVFAAYNRAVWPAQLVGLAVMWLWTGVAYHAPFFARINPAAIAFATLFVVQGLRFAHAALLRSDLRFGAARGARAGVGWALVVYSVLVYPLIGIASHGYPAMPMFGITPCPVTLFSLGLLLLAQPPVPRRLLVIPSLWALIGGRAALLLAVPQDWPLLLGGVLVVPWLWRRTPAAIALSA